MSIKLEPCPMGCGGDMFEGADCCENCAEAGSSGALLDLRSENTSLREALEQAREALTKCEAAMMDLVFKPPQRSKSEDGLSTRIEAAQRLAHTALASITKALSPGPEKG